MADPTPTGSVKLSEKGKFSSDFRTAGIGFCIVSAATLGWFRLDGRVGQVIESAERRDRVVESIQDEVRLLHDALIYQRLLDPSGRTRSAGPPDATNQRTTSRAIIPNGAIP